MPANALGQPIGPSLPGWVPPSAPTRVTLTGRWCRVEPLDPARHGADLWLADSADRSGESWTSLSIGPFGGADEHRAWLERFAASSDPLAFAIVDSSNNQAVGVASYLRIALHDGVIEVGQLHFSPALQRTAAATEAVFLLMRNAFDLGYRRFEWKCDALNAPSRAAAARLGFVYEGVFRQAVVYKGRSRDTAWYSIIDSEWPALRIAYESWLSPDNLDANGRQRRSLSSLTAPLATQSLVAQSLVGDR